MVAKTLIAIGVILAILFLAFVVAMYKLAYYITEEFERW